MFFILSGEILVKKLTFDKSENEIINKPIKIFGAGEFFGHVGLIYNEKRTASFYTESE